MFTSVCMYMCACGEQRPVSGSLMTVILRCNLKFCIQYMVIARLKNKKDIKKLGGLSAEIIVDSQVSPS